MRRSFFLSLASLLLGSALLQSQVDPGDCDTCWKNYVYEDGFIIGAHQIEHLEYGLARYPLSFHQMYVRSGSSISEGLHDTTAIDWVEDATHPWGGYWALLDEFGNARTASRYGTYVEEIQSALYGRSLRKNLETGVTVSMNPVRSNSIYLDRYVRENYYVLPEALLGGRPDWVGTVIRGDSHKSSTRHPRFQVDIDTPPQKSSSFVVPPNLSQCRMLFYRSTSMIPSSVRIV